MKNKKNTSKYLLKFENKNISSIYTDNIPEKDLKIKNLLTKRKKPKFTELNKSKLLKTC